MKSISEVMTRDVKVVAPNDSIQHVAEIMAKADIGSVPVSENDKLVGMVTDRDIVLRAIALGKGVATSARDVMTANLHYCLDTDTVTSAADKMSSLGVRRLPVVDANKRLVGIVSLSNVAAAASAPAIDKMLSGVATPH